MLVRQGSGSARPLLADPWATAGIETGVSKSISGKGVGKMRIIALIVGLLLMVPACATNYNHSENIEVDHFGATGSYSDSRSGTLCKMSLIGGGGGGGGAVGAGALALSVDSSQSQSDPRYFARSIVMVDLTKRLKSIKVDEADGTREYEYVQPGYSSTKPQSSLPSSFGHQPIQ